MPDRTELEQVLAYKDELISLLKLLHEKTFSNRGFAWSGKLLSNTLLTMTHTYPLENKFVNPDEWNSDGTTCRIVDNLNSPLR